MKRMEMDKGKIPVERARKSTRFRDSYYWTKAVDRSTTSGSGYGVNEVQTENRNRDRDQQQQQHHHRPISKDSQSQQLTQRSSQRSPSVHLVADRAHSSSRGRPYTPQRNSTAGDRGTHHSSPKQYRSTKICGLRYKFHSDKNGKIEEKGEEDDDDEEETELQKKRVNLSRKNPVPTEQLEVEEERRQAYMVTRETVNQLTDIQTRKVDQPNGHDHDDEEDDADVLIIDLSDQERAEMESWAK